MLVLFASLSLAAIQPEPRVSDAVMQAILNFTECTSARLIERMDSEESVEAVVEAVIGACAAQEQALRAQLVAEYGADGPSAAREVRSGVRESLLETVAGARGAPLPPDPFRAWGECLGNAATTRGRPAMAADAAVDAALADCRGLEEAARREAVTNMGQNNAEVAMRNFRERFRMMIVRSRNGQLGNPG